MSIDQRLPGADTKNSHRGGRPCPQRTLKVTCIWWLSRVDSRTGLPGAGNGRD